MKKLVAAAAVMLLAGCASIPEAPAKKAPITRNAAKPVKPMVTPVVQPETKPQTFKQRWFDRFMKHKSK